MERAAPSIGVVLSICFIGSVNLTLAATLLASRWRWAWSTALARQAGRHRDYAKKAAAVDGELVDVIGNFGVVRAFGATFREQSRIGDMETEMAARRRSLYYLEHIRLVHAVLTAMLTAGVIGWGMLLWQQRPGQGRRPRADHRTGLRHPARHAATSRWRWSI